MYILCARFPREIACGWRTDIIISCDLIQNYMQKTTAIGILFLCIAMILGSGCTSTTPAGPSPAATPVPASSSVEDSLTGPAPIVQCTVGPSADASKTSQMEITSARGQGVTKNVFMMSVTVRNLGGEGVAYGLAGKTCNTGTGTCVNDKVGVILQAHETAEFSLVTTDGCPGTDSTADNCRCEAWFDVLT